MTHVYMQGKQKLFIVQPALKDGLDGRGGGVQISVVS